MLGAGFVTKPTLDILSDAGISVTVGTYRVFLPSLLSNPTSKQASKHARSLSCHELASRLTLLAAAPPFAICNTCASVPQTCSSG